MPVLYDKPECPFCWRVRMCLARVEANVEQRAFDAPQWREVWPGLTPQGSVPVMLDGDLCMTDSRVILEYIEDAFGGTLPVSARGRAEARELLVLADDALGAAARDFIFACRAHPPGQRDETVLLDAARRWQQALPGLAARLGPDDWLVGRCSQADYAVLTRFALAYAYGMPRDGLPCNLSDWMWRMLQRDEVVSTAPPIVIDWYETAAEELRADA